MQVILIDDFPHHSRNWYFLQENYNSPRWLILIVIIASSFYPGNGDEDDETFLLP